MIAIQPAQQKNEESTLDKVLKGLQIAGGIIQIPESLKNIQKANQEIKARQDERKFAMEENERLRKGIIGGKEKISFTEKGLTQVEPGTKGSTTFQTEGEIDPATGKPTLKDVAYIKAPTESKLTEYQRRSLGLAEQRLAKEKAPTGDQSKTATFAKRVQSAENDLQELAAGGYNRAEYGSGLGASLPNALQSPEAQRQNQAERNFVNAVLRRESGAAISPSEFESANIQYFPRAGDSQEVLDQKARNRADALNGLIAEAGPAYKKLEGSSNLADKLNAKAPKTVDDINKLLSQKDVKSQVEAYLDKKKLQTQPNKAVVSK